MVSNKKLGNDFEQEFCNILSSKGYWVHNFANRKNGQPADVIAAKDGKALLFDCKVCSNGYFDKGRIEVNQDMAMKKWLKCNKESAFFALKLKEGVYILPYSLMGLYKKILSRDFILRVGTKLSDFLEEREYWCK